MPTALLFSDKRPDDAGGRAEKMATRLRLFADAGWDVELVHVPEPYIPLAPVMLLRAIRRARAIAPDLVISINNPFHMHSYGYAASQAVGVPWVAEFRDPMLTHPDWQSESLMRSVAARLEAFTLRNADSVVWLDGIQLPDDYFEQAYPDVPNDRYQKLPFMGYERERFDPVDPLERDAFTITYAGSFYEGWIEPYGFLDGLGRIEPDQPIEAHFYGDWDDAYEQATARAGVSDAVVTHGSVPHDEVIPAIKGSDAVLYIGGADPDNELNVPSKIWDYIGAHTPIIGLVDPSFRVASFIRDHDIGVVAPPDDPEAIANAIEDIYTGRYTYDPDPDIFEQFTRHSHVQTYVDILNSVLTEPR